MIRALPKGIAKRAEAIGLWLALGMFGIVVALSIVSTLALVRSAKWVDHTHKVIESLGALTVGLSEAASERRAFSLTGDDEELARYALATRSSRDAEGRVRMLTTDNLIQQRRLDELEPLLARHIAGLDAAIESRRTRGLEPDREVDEIREASTGDGEIRRLVFALTAEEHRLLVERDWSTADRVTQVEILEAIGAGVGLSLIAGIVVRLRREIARRERSELAVLEREHAIKLLNEGLEGRVKERTAELEAATRELESFSYSVVHNLRAPLRGMGGFAEVVLEECAGTLRADAEDSLREIVENARNMASLIDALVSMAKIARSELSRAGVNLSGLARAAGDRLAVTRGWSSRSRRVSRRRPIRG